MAERSKTPVSRNVLYPAERTIRTYQYGIVIDYQKAREELRQRNLLTH